MKLGFQYNSSGESGNPEVHVFNADTGEPVELVMAVSFSMKVGDVAPTMHIQCLPSRVSINGAEATEVTQADMDMFATRSRSIDLDGVSPNEQ